MNQRCPHCPGGFGLKYPLLDDKYFWIVCDVHPLVEGHIIIIPKGHISCIGALDKNAFARFKELYEKVLSFLNSDYGRAGIFEHGIAGQTVLHAHMHFLPFDKSIKDIVPEKDYIKKVSDLDEIKAEFDKNRKYLYVAIKDEKWLVDTKIAYPGFFRDRFAKSLGIEERGNWKKAEKNPELMVIFEKDIQQLKNKWGIRS